LALLVAFAGGARAEPITFVFTGTVSTVDDRFGLLDRSVTVGTRFTGSYTFESTTPDSNPDPTVGDYWHRVPGYGITVTLGNYTFRTNPADVEFLLEVVHRAPPPASTGDNYLLRSYRNSPLAPGLLVDHISWQLDDPTGTALSSDALPLTPPNLADWTSIFGLTITGGDAPPPFGDQDYFIRGHVDSVSAITAVPEPGSLILLSIAALGLVGYVQRCKKQKGRLTNRCT
jgi:hypothetical protein